MHVRVGKAHRSVRIRRKACLDANHARKVDGCVVERVYFVEQRQEKTAPVVVARWLMLFFPSLRCSHEVGDLEKIRVLGKVRPMMQGPRGKKNGDGEGECQGR